MTRLEADDLVKTGMTSFHLDRISIGREVADSSIARRWSEYGREQGIPVVLRDPIQPSIHQGQTLLGGKREVYVARHKGPAIKPCRGLDRTGCIPCRLHVINQTSNCPFHCSYCFLQDYMNNPVTTVHANLDEMRRDFEWRLAQQPHRLFRVTTGDLGDSLAYDEITGANRALVKWFAKIPNAVLELKSKSDRVAPLLGLPHQGRSVVSWSLNPPEVVSAEEHRTASLDQRLDAAVSVVEADYLVAFHFDPMVVVKGWEESYAEVVARIFERIPADRIAWISMGSFRFPPAMLKGMEQNFPLSRLTLGELKLASDGKMRYLKPTRIRLYRTLSRAIREAGGSDIFTYLCMEIPEVWRRVMGYVPEPDHGLDFEFARSLVRRFPHLMPESPRVEHYRDAEMLGEA